MNYISPSSRQFYPTTLHGTRLQFFGYGSLISTKHQSFSKPQKFFVTCSLSEQDPERKSNVPSTSKSLSLSEHNSRSSSSNSSSNNSRSNWLNKWNEPNKGNRRKPPQDVVNYRRSRDSKGSLLNSGFGRSDNGSGGGGGTTMDRIVEKLKKFGYMEDGDDDSGKKGNGMERVIEKGSVEDIFYMEEGLLPNARGGFSGEAELGGLSLFQSNGDVKFPWERTKGDLEEGKWSARSKSKTSIAEATLPESELRRLRLLTFKTKQKIRVRGGGVTQAIVDAIREKWQTSEIVRLKIEGAAALNMKRIHEILERKTGGLVIWRSGTAVSLYRGVGYEDPSVKLNKRIFKKVYVSSGSVVKPAVSDRKDSLPDGTLEEAQTPETSVEDVSQENKDTEAVPEIHYEDEIDKLLDGLGPRYEEWAGCEPLPVDADLLPGTIPGYQPPFRILPYGVRPTLGQKEATSLRRLARVLPPHFALGRSRQLQGLAAAVIKLWEKSKIAKIALKRGVQLTTSERMAEDLKKLTGGMLLSRNKDFLVFFRGKNFLSPEVTEALLERERLAKYLQDEEEQARMRASALVAPIAENYDQSGNAGTLTETLDANAKWAKTLDDHHREKVMREVEISRHASLVRKLERKLAFAERRLRRGERALSKVEASLQPSDRQADPDSITGEERFMFRKLGLRMKAFLLLGRRGVFDGTVENMHLHWKYRELVKLIVKAQSFDQAKKIALALEAESGGVLVSVDKVSKGYAIIVFRGKDYQRPSTLRPKNLLTKRKALARSIELQRREALLKHVTALQNKVETIRSEIEQMANIKDEGDEALYDRLDSEYLTDEEDSEEEGEGAYSETYDPENDVEEKGNIQRSELSVETEYSYDLEDEQSETEGEDLI